MVTITFAIYDAVVILAHIILSYGVFFFRMGHNNCQWHNSEKQKKKETNVDKYMHLAHRLHHYSLCECLSSLLLDADGVCEH